MGLRSLFKREVVKHASRRAEKELPMLRRWIDWLSDPNAKGRKRNMAVCAGLVSGALRGMGKALTPMCVEGIAAGALCSADLVGYASWVETTNLIVQNVIVPGVDIFAVGIGAVAVIHGRRKDQAEKEAVRPRAW